MDIAGSLIRQLGFDPKQLQAAVIQAISDCAAVKTEVMAAKAGFVSATGHFNARLNALEQNAIIQTQLLTAIALSLGVVIANQPENEHGHEPGSEQPEPGTLRLNGTKLGH